MPREIGLIDAHALAGAYALDALTEMERAAFARHVAECESCALEVAELQEAAGRLADLAVYAPPLRLKRAVLTTIARTPQTRGGRVRTARASVRRWHRWTAAAVAAGIVAVGAAVGTWAVDQQRVGGARAEASRLRAVLAAPDLQVHTGAAAGGRVTVVVSPSHNEAVAVLDGLAAPGNGKAYQLWLLRPNGAQSVGLLKPGQQATTTRIGPIGDAKGFAVSRERAEVGAPPGQPTLPVVGKVDF